jgi:hypothetical protein
LRGEHKVDAILFEKGRAFVLFLPDIDVALDGEVVVGEEVDAETMLAL